VKKLREPRKRRASGNFKRTLKGGKSGQLGKGGLANSGVAHTWELQTKRTSKGQSSHAQEGLGENRGLEALRIMSGALKKK